jgi:hypothetical protein
MPLEPPAPNPTPDPPRPQRDPGGGTPPPSPNPTPGGRGDQARLEELAQEIARAVAAGDEHLAESFRQALREQEQLLAGHAQAGAAAPAPAESFLRPEGRATQDRATWEAKQRYEATMSAENTARRQAQAEQARQREAEASAAGALRRERLNDLLYRGGQPLYAEAGAPAAAEVPAPVPARSSESLEGRSLWRAGLEQQAEARARAGLGGLGLAAAAESRARAADAARHQAEVNRAAATLEPVPLAQPPSAADRAARGSLGAAAADAHRRTMAAARTEAVVTGASEAAGRGRQKAEEDMAESGRRAAAALSALPRVAAGVAGSFYTLERTVREGNPVVAGTFEQSARLLQGRIGRDLAPVVEDVTRGVQGAADAYSGIPPGVRQWGWQTFQRTFNPLVQLAGVGKMFGLGAGKPELSFEGLPRPRTTTFADYAAGLSAAGLQLGPLDQRVQQEKIAAMLETIGGETGKVADNTVNTKNFFPTFGR